MAKFPLFRQLDSADCGPACLQMVAKHYGKEYPLSYFREHSFINKQGVSLPGMAEAAETIGFITMMVRIPFSILEKEQPLPCILHWRQDHFVVLYKISNQVCYIADPAVGYLEYNREEMEKFWSKGDAEMKGIGLLLDPGPEFFKIADRKKDKKTGFGHFLKYLLPYRSLIFQLFLGLIAGSLLSLILPFMTRSLVDVGVMQNNLDFIYLVLISQLMIFIGSSVVSIIRSWILLHLSTRINIAIVSDFLLKLMKLPISFFDARNLGDILQRIRDNDRIRQFLTSSSLQTLFSLINILIFGAVLLSYDLVIFGIFFFGSLVYIGWVLLFLKKRKVIDYKRFNEAAASQGNEVQLVQGMQEIKLNQAEKNKRWEWETIQTRLFNVSIKSLTLEQYQNVGGAFLNEVKNVLIMFWSAKSVISGDMTLGMMLAASQITGQLNSPISQLIDFIRQAQDASISLERLGEINNKKDEDDADGNSIILSDYKKDILLKNVRFRYGGPESPWVIDDINLTIPFGKTTAIMGVSGSGKTTLLKLLLKFYAPQEGKILIDNNDLTELNSARWRKQCGVVMQDGYIFSDSIIRNVSISEDQPDEERFNRSLAIANIDEFVETLPLKADTIIGSSGIGLSQGQRQRLMIARATYKEPSFLLFDEATSSLDANNEKDITEKLKVFGDGRTMIIIAHRLSTVKNADQIVVLSNGKIAEIGSHRELTAKRGMYFELVRNQLELGE